MPKSKMDETEVETVVRLGATDVRDVFPDISTEDADSRMCLLCNMRLKDKTHNLTRHLERHHLGALLQLVEQRNAAAATTTSAPAPQTPVQAASTPKAARTPPAQSSTTSSSAKSRRRPKRAADLATAVAAASIALDAAQDTDSSKSAAAASPSSAEQVDSATHALVRWLVYEQLPLQVVASDSFQRFVRSLNANFDGALAPDLVQRALTALHTTDNDDVDADSLAATTSRATKRVKRESTSASPAPVVTTRALVARCRVSDDVPRVQLEHLPCRVLPPGYARVHVHLAIASVLDLETCLGDVRGRVGVLGHAFVGVASHVHAPPSAASSVNRIQPQQRVVLAMPQLPCANCVEADKVLSCTHTERFGSSAFSGALAQYVDVPLANVAAVPTDVPDDVALLTSDAALALEIADQLTQRSIAHVAVVTDGAGSPALALLVRYLHTTGGLARDHIHVFATAALSHMQQTQLETHAIVTLMDVQHPEALDDVLSEQLAFNGVVDLCSTNASMAFAISLVQPMGAIVLVDRARLHAPAPTKSDTSTLALNMNAVVVNELEVVSLSDSGAGTTDVAPVLAYLAAEAQEPERKAELQELLMAPVELDAALKTLSAVAKEDVMAQYVTVRCDSSKAL